LYLTYDEFLEYGGSITDETRFERHEFRARMLLDLFTLGRIDSTVKTKDELKRCMYELVETYEQEMKQTDGMIGVASVSNDGVSVNYSNSDVGASVKKRCIEIITQYLSNVCDSKGVSLLYKGVVQ